MSGGRSTGDKPFRGLSWEAGRPESGPGLCPLGPAWAAVTLGSCTRWAEAGGQRRRELGLQLSPCSNRLGPGEFCHGVGVIPLPSGSVEGVPRREGQGPRPRTSPEPPSFTPLCRPSPAPHSPTVCTGPRPPSSSSLATSPLCRVGAAAHLGSGCGSENGDGRPIILIEIKKGLDTQAGLLGGQERRHLRLSLG